MMNREPDETNLRWFGAWNKTSWEVGKTREAYASGRGGRYQIERIEEGFVLRYHPPNLAIWEQIGAALTQEVAIALAQAHNDTPA